MSQDTSAPDFLKARSTTGVSIGSGELPASLLEGSARRVGWVALFYAITYVLVFGSGMVGAFLFAPEKITAGQRAGLLVAVVCIGAGLALWWLSRSRRVSPATLLDYALLFEVFGAFGILGAGFVLTLGEENLDAVKFVGVSWVGVWIIGFAVIVPATRGKSILAAFAAASMGPLGGLIGSVVHGVRVPADVWLSITLPDYLCAGIAVWLSGIVFRLGRRIHKAEQMGRYHLTERLGRGGMGEVWRAEHEMLARAAAIKLIRQERLGEVDSETGLRMLRRFEREVQTTATLTSPHTIELYDFGRTPDGAFFYVMELLNGLDLATLVERFGPLPADRVTYLLLQVCSSLSEAHLAGLIHRDIKPANIYLCRKGIEYDYVKVLDFGLVKTMGDTSGREMKLTAEGVAAGSPAFMAPEVATAGEVDVRVDLYSLGCVAYWLLTGQMVFEGTSPMQVVLQHIQQDPTPPSQIAELEVPPALEQIVLDCLAKKPLDRPGSADELAQRLQASGAASGWSPRRARQWWERHLPEHGLSKGVQKPDVLAEGGPPGA